MKGSVVKSSKPNIPAGAVATLADINRLWDTLTTEYIPGLKIEIKPMRSKEGFDFVLVELVDYAMGSEFDMPTRSVWARKEFRSPLYLISHTQLFDLLISGYRTIDELFSTGKDNRPPPMKG